MKHSMQAEIQTETTNTDHCEMVKEFYTQVFMNRSVDICDQVMVDDYINHSSLVKNGRENFKDYFLQYYKTFSKTDSEIKHLFEKDDLVCVYADHWASNKLFSVKFKAIDIYRIKSGKLVEHWDSIEALNGFSRFMFTVKAILKL